MRKIKILNINATVGGTPGSIEVATDFTPIFQGKFYRNPSTGEVTPSYTSPAPSGSILIKATTFEIVENSKYAGRYTVYTPASGTDRAASTFGSGKTTVNVNEIIPAIGSDASLSSAGYITNISTYLLYTGTSTIVVPPAVDITSYPVEFMGRDSAGWGEAFAQNFLNIARNFANSTAPSNPFVGMTWLNTDDGQMRVWNGTSWALLNQATVGATYKHSQTTAAATWVVNHNLNLASPFIGFVQFFVDRGAGPKMIIPSDVTFNSKDQLTVTFSNQEIGYVLVRQ
jgi:hypothetical protein